MVDKVEQEDNLDNILAPVEQAEPIHIGAMALAKPEPTPVRPQAEPVKRSTKKIPDDIRKQVKELAAGGKTVRQIAATLGISKTTAATINNEPTVPIVASAAIPQILSTGTVEPMDDASFASAITGVSSSNAVVEAKPIPKATIDKILADFGSVDPMPLAKKQKGKGKLTGLDAFMAELDMPETKAKPAKGLAKPSSQMFLPSEEFEDKSVYIAKIQMNVDNFADVLKDHIKPDRDGFLAKVSKMSLSDLNSTLKLLETIRSSNNLANQMKYLLYGGANFIELGTQRFLGLKTQGYAQQLRQQEAEIQSCLREIAINNVESYKKIERPEMRLATVLVTTLLATDSRNRLEGMRNDFKNKAVSSEQEDKFNDL
jgi:hypothetical protein